MSNQALKAVTGGEVAKRPEKMDIAHLLNSPAALAQIKAALPSHMKPERMARVALTEVRKTPKLARCEPRTFLGALIQLSQLGLEPGGALGHAYLLPFDNRKEGTTDVQLIIGYRGMIDLARRSGQIASIQAVIVRQGDDFAVRFGLDPNLHHVPAFDDDKPMTHVYAVAVFKDGGKQFEVMTRGQVEKVRAQSRSGTSGPWVSHFDEMAKKTVIRRLFKYLPVSVELQTAVALDERGDAGLAQVIDDMGAIEGSATEIDEDAPRLTSDAGSSYAEIASLIAAAKTADDLDIAADLIRGVADEKQRAELDVEVRAKRKALA